MYAPGRKFGVDVDSLVAIADVLAGPGVARVGRTALNHKAFHRPIEQRLIEMPIPDQIEKLVAVLGSIVVEHQPDVAHVSPHKHVMRLRRKVGTDKHRRPQKR